MSPKNILLIKTHALGDVLMTTPAIHAIRARFPGARLTLLTSPEAAELLVGSADVDAFLPVGADVWFGKGRLRLPIVWQRIRRGGFDLAVCFQQSGALHALIRLAGVGEVYGLGTPSRWLTRAVSWEPRAPRPAAAKFADLALALGASPPEGLMPRLALTEAERLEALAILSAKRHSPERPLVGVFPGGGANSRDTVLAKRWPVERFAEVCRRIGGEGTGEVILLGGPGDATVISEVKALAGIPLVDASGGGLRQFMARLAACAVLVTNDSLPLHVAMGLGTPVVAIFGPSDHRALIPESPQVKVLAADLPCSPCYANEPFPPCQLGTPRCMERTEAGVVLAAVEEMLGFASAAQGE